MPLLSLIASKLKVTSANGPNMCRVVQGRRPGALGRSPPPGHLESSCLPLQFQPKIQGDPWVMASQWTVTTFNKEGIGETEAGVGGSVEVGYA